MKNSERQKTLSTEPYKGVRDFYPEDMFVRRYLFDVMRTVVERYGYVEYDASVLEPTELYRAKTGDEIVNEQTYSFTDRGGRDVTLRPEMTPTVARMVAARQRELVFPLRWFSLPNLFRYERPQRGRLREHWQLNVDMFGEESIAAEVEVITLAADIMRRFGAKETDCIIRINHRKLLTMIIRDYLAVSDKTARALMKLLDRKPKMPDDEWYKGIEEILSEKAVLAAACCAARTIEELLTRLPDQFTDSAPVVELKTLFEALTETGIGNAVFDPSLVRGFDYYTGIVFELFDTNPKNSRSLFGGGRYDGLTELFGTPPVPAIGFGMGDVTIRDFLETRGLLPQYRATADLYLCTTDTIYLAEARRLAQTLRNAGINVEVNFSEKRVGDQIRTANKKAIPFVICVGPEEVKSKRYTVKHLGTSEEMNATEADIPTVIETFNTRAVG